VEDHTCNAFTTLYQRSFNFIVSISTNVIEYAYVRFLNIHTHITAVFSFIFDIIMS